MKTPRYHSTIEGGFLFLDSLKFSHSLSLSFSPARLHPFLAKIDD